MSAANGGHCEPGSKRTRGRRRVPKPPTRISAARGIARSAATRLQRAGEPPGLAYPSYLAGGGGERANWAKTGKFNECKKEMQARAREKTKKKKEKEKKRTRCGYLERRQSRPAKGEATDTKRSRVAESDGSGKTGWLSPGRGPNEDGDADASR